MEKEQIADFIKKESNVNRKQYMAVYVASNGVERIVKKFYNTKEELIENNVFISKEIEVLTIREISSIKEENKRTYYYNLYRFRWTHLSVSRPYNSLLEAEMQRNDDHVFFETRIIRL